MMFLNDYDLDRIAADVDRDNRPNLLRLAMVVSRLADWTNRNSDGWGYWAKPSRAAKRAADHLYREYIGRYDQRTGEDITDAELVACLRPIKAFLTRQGVADPVRQRIVR